MPQLFLTYSDDFNSHFIFAIIFVLLSLCKNDFRLGMVKVLYVPFGFIKVREYLSGIEDPAH